MTKWTALIQTSTGVLQRINFDSASGWRQDAIAQVQGTYGAKKVISCNPAGNTIVHKSGNKTRNSNPVVAAAATSAVTLTEMLLVPIIFLILWFIPPAIILTTALVSAAIVVFRKLRY